MVFHSLTKADLAKIVDIQIRMLADRLAGRDIETEVSRGACELLAELGWDSAFGARPLKRVVQKRLENELARRILDGGIVEGSRVRIDNAGKGFTFEVAAGPEPKSVEARQGQQDQPDGEPEVIEGEIVE